MTAQAPYRPQVKERPSPVGAIVSLVIGLIVFGIVVFFIVHSGSHSSSIQKKLGGDEIFEAGKATTLAKHVSAGGPILYPDLLKQQHGTIVFVQHLGTDSKKGWYAFAARPANEAAGCQVRWRANSQDFFDECSGNAYSINGQGLKQFKVAVENGIVTIDLHKTNG